MELIGKPSINPFIFYTGKISGYITWIVFVYSFSNDNFVSKTEPYNREILAISLSATGIIFTIVSLLNLGKSIRLGLPAESTLLKSNGIYRISRNPMYVGFGLFTIASMIYTFNVAVIIIGIFSLVVYHFIIKSEEKFLQRRFSTDYENYQKKVRRYL